uniref:AAA+ ATPase domain-containing protein n=1 Tax=Tetradesmus obliquus TaxID=3088 RepID=A0A383WAE8_TETOB|eukprot:jgi/Sobl393_1/16730/SZX74431.1
MQGGRSATLLQAAAGSSTACCSSLTRGIARPGSGWPARQKPLQCHKQQLQQLVPLLSRSQLRRLPCRPCPSSANEQQGLGSSSSSSSDAAPGQAAEAAAAAAEVSQAAAASSQTAEAARLTVEAVQADPAATIDTINRLTRQEQAAADSSSSSPDTAQQQQQQQQQSQEQQQPFASMAAAAAAVWAAARQHWQSLLAMLAAAVAAMRGQLSKLPSWVAAQKLQRLREAADEAPKDAAKQAAYLAALNQAHPRDVLYRVESKSYASSPAVVVEYLKALVATERLNEFADVPASSGAAGGSGSGAAVGLGPLLAPGQDHRSLVALLRELQGMAEGQAAAGYEPGSSLRRPLHVVLQGPGLARLRKPAGPFSLLWSLASSLLLLLGLAFAWLVGSQALQRVGSGAGDSHAAGRSSVVSGTAGAGSSAGGVSSPAAGPGIEPKEYKREELPEKSIKSFADVKGCDESKAELQEVVEFLKDPAKFTRLGAKLPKGVLLTGPPGTGKTLLAKAVAGEAGVPFFYRAGSEFEELYVGVGSRRMRALFAAAKKKAPCIVFIDEIDAIGGNRKHWENHTRKTLNQLLVEMDGFEANEGVIVMAATNLPETLDPALKRPGRFDRQVAVPLPDVKGRAEILEYYLSDKPVAAGLDQSLLARQTSGFSGADLSNLINEAALLAAKRGADAISGDMIEYAYDKVLMGVERKSAVRSLESLRRTAYHESGHALVALAVPGASPVHKATIVPRGHALGMVTQVGREDEFSINRQQMLARILVSMGGTVAEELVFGRDQVSSGATDDLRQATNMARHMVMQCGLNDELGPLYIEDEKLLSESTKQQIDTEVRGLLINARNQVKALLTEQLEQLHSVAAALLDHETLTAGQIKSVLAGEKLAPALLDFAQRNKQQQPKPEEGAEVAPGPEEAALDEQ